MVTYDLVDGVATIRMDDGKVNALSPTMLAAIGEAVDRAEADGAAIVLAGRDGRFSAGFDLAILNAGGDDAIGMLRGGFETSLRLLSFHAHTGTKLRARGPMLEALRAAIDLDMADLGG